METLLSSMKLAAIMAAFVLFYSSLLIGGPMVVSIAAMGLRLWAGH